MFLEVGGGVGFFCGWGGCFLEEVESCCCSVDCCCDDEEEEDVEEGVDVDEVPAFVIFGGVFYV